MKERKVNQLYKSIHCRKIMFGIAIASVVVMVIAFVVIGRNTVKDSEAYREAYVVCGNLTVGITESGTIDIGTIEQTFDLDMSALTRVTTSNSNTSSSNSGAGMGGGGSTGSGGSGGNFDSADMFGQMFNLGGNASSNSSNGNTSPLVVESVEVSVGQEVSVGDVILSLEADGVTELKTELEDNVEKASADLRALIADQELARTTAEYTLDIALAYETYAAQEKSVTLTSLEQDITEAEKTLQEARNSLNRYIEQLNTAKADYENAVTVMNNAIWSRDNVDKYKDTYLYCVYFTEAETAISNVSSLESKVEQLESKVESAESNVKRCETNLAKAKRQYDSGVLTAEEAYELKLLAYNSAQETYDITVSYLEDDLEEQQEKYEETRKKWEEFTSYVDGVNVLSEYNGVVTGISLEPGDSLNTGFVVVALYDTDEVSVTVTVSEEDMSDIVLGGTAVINLTAYPNEVFQASVTQISDATTDSSGNTTREVTVSVNGDVSKLFQGMTGKVTFITKQKTNVLYIPNRAIKRVNGVSYVKVKQENGSVETVKISTGFSDGTNVEILEGLTEGQTVIIEKGDTP
ncbi:MAG: efflux RND transporter periplasmic adaptor subunit [Acetatifactor sp.]